METSETREASASGAGELRMSARWVILTVWVSIALTMAAGIWREVAAAAAGVFTTDFGYDLVRLDFEANLPSALSALLLLAAAILLLIQSRVTPDRRDATYWLVLSIGFLYLGVDEVAQLHEQFKTPLRLMASFTDLLAFPWVIVAIPAVLVAALYFLPFLLRLPRPLALGFVLAGLIYVGGAVGMEMLNGRLSTYVGWGSPYYLIGSVIEEGLEFVGSGLFLTTLVRHMSREAVTIRVSVRS